MYTDQCIKKLRKQKNIKITYNWDGIFFLILTVTFSKIAKKSFPVKIGTS